MRVHSEVDIGVHIVVWGVIFITLLGMFADRGLAAIGFGAALIALILWFYLGTYYELRERYLLCRFGPFSEKIHYDDIRAVRLQRSLLASMALSVNRIAILRHGGGFIFGSVLISPKDRESFMKALMRRCDRLEASPKNATPDLVTDRE